MHKVNDLLPGHNPVRTCSATANEVHTLLYKNSMQVHRVFVAMDTGVPTYYVRTKIRQCILRFPLHLSFSFIPFLFYIKVYSVITLTMLQFCKPIMLYRIIAGIINPSMVDYKTDISY